MDNAVKKKRKHTRRTKPPKITHAALVKAVAASCMYEPYEVEDVLRHLAIVMQQFLLDGNEVRVEGIGIYRLMKCKVLSVEHLKNKERMQRDWYRLSVRKDTWMKEEIKFNNTEKVLRTEACST